MLTLLALIAQLATPAEPLTQLEVQGTTIGVASASVAWLSTDDGATFKRVLDGPKAINAISVSPSGLYVQRGDRVAYRSAKSAAKSAAKWRRLPTVKNGKHEALAAVAGWLVYVMHPTGGPNLYNPQRAYISKDQGRTWRRVLSRPKLHDFYRDSYSPFDTDISIEVNPDGLIVATTEVGSENVRDAGYRFWHVAGGPIPRLDVLAEIPPQAYRWKTHRGWIVGPCDTGVDGGSAPCVVDPKGRAHPVDYGDGGQVRVSPDSRWLWSGGYLIDTSANFKVVKAFGGRLLKMTNDRLWVRLCGGGRCRREETRPSQLVVFETATAKQTVLGPVPPSVEALQVTRQGRAWTLIEGKLMRLQKGHWIPVKLGK